MTDKERIERILKIINLEYPDRKKLGMRMGEVYKILAMDELELLTLDQYRGQNMDYVLEQLQKEGLELGDKMRQIDKEIATKYDVKVVDLQSDLMLLEQFDVENMRDLPKQITQGMSIEPRNKPPDADYYNNLFDEIVSEIDDIEEPNITLNPDGSTTEIIDSTYTDDLGIEYGVQQEINRDVPLDEFKTMFGGSPSDYKMPEILDDLKGTGTYDSVQFQLWAMELEYQDRQKFKNIINRQYEIFYEFLKENPNLSIENKKELLEAVRKRTLMLDEKYGEFTVKNDVDLSLEELTTFDNELDDINKNFKTKLEGALDNIKLGMPNELNRDVRHLQIDELALSDEYKKYIKEIQRDTDSRFSPEIIRKLDDALDTTAGKQAVETMILNLRNGVTKYGAYSLHHLLNDYGANYFSVMGAKQEIAFEYYSRMDEILESHLNPNVPDPDIEMKIQFDFAESKLRELGKSDIDIENIKKTNEFFRTGRAFTDPNMLNEFNNIVSNIDNVDDNVIDFREKQLEKLIQEVEDATPDVTKITPSQAEMIDNALADAAAQLSRSQFNVIEGGIGRKYTAQQILKVAGQKLGKLFIDGITLLDIYELGLIAYALGEPVVELITKFIFPDLKTESPTYGQQVMENFEVITKISPTDRLLMKAADEIEEQFGFRPGDISEEITSVDTSPVRPVLYSPDSDRTVPVQSFTPPSIYEKTKERFQPATLEEKTGYDEYNQFLQGMHGMLGGNNGEK